MIRAPNGADVLIDAGPPGGASSRALAESAPGDRSIDLLALTHQDLDHSGGAREILVAFSVAALAAPAWTGKAAPIVSAAAAPPAELRRGDRVWLDRAAPVYLDVLWPPADISAGDGNDWSLVARLVYGSTTALLTGDAPRGVERLLAAAGDPLDVDVLKAGHHGSKTSSDPGFVSAASPAYVVVSAGEGNRYGHPSPETLATARASGAAILSTVDLGTVSFLWDGQSLTYSAT